MLPSNNMTASWILNIRTILNTILCLSFGLKCKIISAVCTEKSADKSV